MNGVPLHSHSPIRIKEINNKVEKTMIFEQTKKKFGGLESSEFS